MMEWTPEQIAELTQAGHHHPKPGVRVKARAALAVAKGHTRQQVAELFGVSRVSVGAWVKAFRGRGVPALEIAPGRGRKRQIDDDELASYARQAPAIFGVERSRWTVAALAQVVPSAHGMSSEGVRQALHRQGLRHKRGQPWLHSPDPEYEKKTK